MKSNFYYQKKGNFFGIDPCFSDDLKITAQDWADISKYKQQHKEAQDTKQYAHDEKGNKIEMTEHFLPPFTA